VKAIKGFLFPVLALSLFGVNLAWPEIITIPVSNKYFEGEISFQDGTKAQFESREGALIRVRQNLNSPEATGLVLHLGKDANKVKVLVLKIQTAADSAKSDKPPIIDLNSALEIRQSNPIKLVLKRVGERQFPHPPSNLQAQSEYSAELCCVEFGGKQVCANAVTTPAGTCSPN